MSHLPTKFGECGLNIAEENQETEIFKRENVKKKENWTSCFKFRKKNTYDNLYCLATYLIH